MRALGFHSNNALGTTIVVDPNGNPVDRVTPLVRATGSRSRCPHRRPAPPAEHAFALGARPRFGACLQRRCGRDGTGTGKQTLRHRVRELLQLPNRGWCSTATSPGRTRASPSSTKRANTCPRRWTWSSRAARALTTSTGCLAAFACDTSDPRALVEDNSVRSKATTLLNLEAGTSVQKNLRVNLMSSTLRIRP